MLKVNHLSINETTRRLCEGYWGMDFNGNFLEKATEVAAEYNISVRQLQNIALSQCTVSASWLECQNPSCASMSPVTSRTDLLTKRTYRKSLCDTCSFEAKIIHERPRRELESLVRLGIAGNLENKKEFCLDRYYYYDFRFLLSLGALMLCYGEGLKDPFPHIDKLEGKLLGPDEKSSREIFNQLLQRGFIVISPRSDLSSVVEWAHKSPCNFGGMLVSHPLTTLHFTAPFTKNNVSYDPLEVQYQLNHSDLKKLAKEIIDLLEKKLISPQPISELNSFYKKTSLKECENYLNLLLRETKIHDIYCPTIKEAINRILSFSLRFNSVESTKHFIFKAVSLADNHYTLQGNDTFSSHKLILDSLSGLKESAQNRPLKKNFPFEQRQTSSAVRELCELLLYSFADQDPSSFVKKEESSCHYI